MANTDTDEDTNLQEQDEDDALKIQHRHAFNREAFSVEPGSSHVPEERTGVGAGINTPAKYYSQVHALRHWNTGTEELTSTQLRNKHVNLFHCIKRGGWIVRERTKRPGFNVEGASESLFGDDVHYEIAATDSEGNARPSVHCLEVFDAIDEFRDYTRSVSGLAHLMRGRYHNISRPLVQTYWRVCPDERRSSEKGKVRCDMAHLTPSYGPKRRRRGLPMQHGDGSREGPIEEALAVAAPAPPGGAALKSRALSITTRLLLSSKVGSEDRSNAAAVYRALRGLDGDERQKEAQTAACDLIQAWDAEQAEKGNGEDGDNAASGKDEEASSILSGMMFVLGFQVGAKKEDGGAGKEDSEMGATT